METFREWMQPELVWFIAGMVLLIAEFAVPGLVIFFFGVGALLVATLCFLFDLSLNTQLLIFLLSSLILLLSLRRWMKKIFIGKTNAESELDDMTSDFIGRKALVTDRITPSMPGKIELNGTHWNAESDQTIPKGVPIQIIGKNNLTLLVKPIPSKTTTHKGEKS